MSQPHEKDVDEAMGVGRDHARHALLDDGAPRPSFRGYSLDALAAIAGQPEEALRAALFRPISEASLVEMGTQIDSRKLLDDIPHFAASALETTRALSPEQRSLLKLNEAVIALLVDEAIQLRALKAELDAGGPDTDGTKARREASARLAMREGIALRDIVYDALRNTLGDEGMHEVDDALGTAQTAESLAHGMEALSAFVRRLREESRPGDAVLLDAFGLDEACAASLDEKAARVREAGRSAAAPSARVTQRRLDLQDGRVAHLFGIVLRAFRAARRADSAIKLPEMRTAAWLFEARAARTKAEKGEGDAE